MLKFEGVRIMRFIIITSMLMFFANSYADGETVNTTQDAYRVNPGDIIEINVWKEEGLVQEVLVRPDGGISFPLAGDLNAQGMTLSEIEKAISKKLGQYIADPVVTVSAKQLLGNKIYVVGKVLKPGEYVASSHVDVMQALSMAGGMTPFAAVNNIVILRRDKDNKQIAIEFEYGEVEDGDDLQQNIMLQPGDVVVVP